MGGSLTSNFNVRFAVGTENPFSKLHTYAGNVNEANYFQMTNLATGSASASDGFRLGIDGTGIGELRQQENLPMLFYTNNSERMRVTNIGSVGIGISAPEARLHVIPNTDRAFDNFAPSNVSITGKFENSIQSGTLGNNLALYALADGAEVASIAGRFSANGNFGNTPETYGLQVYATGANSTNYGMRLMAAGSTSGFITNYGIYAEASGGFASVAAFNNASGGSVNYGLLSYATGSGTNYGVYGYAAGSSSNNYAVYGEVNTRSGTTPPGGPDYAGYFTGDVAYTGTIGQVSDAVFKTNINDLANSLSMINQLQPKTFNFKTADYPYMVFPSGVRYGLIAQEVEAVLPELVSTAVHPAKYDSAGNQTRAELQYKSLNYEAFIPMLIDAVKELSSKVDSLQEIVNDQPWNNGNAKTAGSTSTQALTVKNIELGGNTVVLEQNVPNPFAEQTTINYFIPDDVKFAQVIFYDNLGRIIKTVDITEKGGGQLNVFANNLGNGIYSYSLVVDGKVTDTKKMLRTK